LKINVLLSVLINTWKTWNFIPGKFLDLDTWKTWITGFFDLVLALTPGVYVFDYLFFEVSQVNLDLEFI